MKLLIVWIAASFSLVGCQSTGGGCPPLVKYSSETQRAAASELRAGKSPNMGKMVVDYGKMREACR